VDSSVNDIFVVAILRAYLLIASIGSLRQVASWVTVRGRIRGVPGSERRRTETGCSQGKPKTRHELIFSRRIRWSVAVCGVLGVGLGQGSVEGGD
jgi:hypothetical protein